MALSWSAVSPERVLRERFNMQAFHPGQREIIENLVRGKRVVAIQRTGWGKSLCYQLTSFYYPHMTLVFSPLKALMRDQCQRCNEVYHIPSAIVSSDFSPEENIDLLKKAAEGKIKILYIAPERLDNLSWQTHVIQMSISMVIVDEAHCISTWGHDFRPHYRRIVTLLNGLPAHVPVLALTATANSRVEQDIKQQVGIDALVIRGSMLRSNLHLNVVNCDGDREKLSYLAVHVPTWPGSGIVYTGTQSSAEMVAAFLKQQDIKAEYYHAGREDSERQRIEQGLMSNQYKVICSTNALGMGIDKPDIRFVVHYHIPASPIHYYQEIGRAGRDGKDARCILLYDAEDLSIQRHFIQSAKPAGKQYERVLALIRNDVQGWRWNDLREQACWIALVFESGLTTRVVNDILVVWCYQRKQSLQAFFAADAQVWAEVCNLNGDALQKLERAREKLAAQAFLIEQLHHASISLLTIFDDAYPRFLKSALKRNQTPPVLFYAGDLSLFQRQTIAIIGSRNASEGSLAFTREIAGYLASQGANVISGNARGVDQAAYDGAVGSDGYTTVVLPHGIRKLSGVKMRALLPKIEAGKVLLLSQFHPDAPWVVSRAMERNKVVTGLAQVVVVAESDTKGGTWDGANGALAQKRPLYVCQNDTTTLPGNEALRKLGAQPLPWPTTNLARTLTPLLHVSSEIQHKQNSSSSSPPAQLSLLAMPNFSQ